MSPFPHTQSGAPRARQAAGTPVGGQFATEQRTESAVTLSTETAPLLDTLGTMLTSARRESEQVGIQIAIHRMREQLRQDGDATDQSFYNSGELAGLPCGGCGDDLRWVWSTRENTHILSCPCCNASEWTDPNIQKRLYAQRLIEAVAATVQSGETSPAGPEAQAGAAESAHNGPTVACVACHYRANDACEACHGTGQMPATPLGQVSVDVPGYGTFTRSGATDPRGGTYFPNTPYFMRIEANRELTDDETQAITSLLGYKYAATVAGEPLDLPVRDSSHSFIVGADTTKSRRSDLGLALSDFEEGLEELVYEGSPVRKTDRAGAGTKGTRLVEGLGDPDLTLAVYWDDVD